MKQSVYQKENPQLPEVVWEALNDRAELSHIRQLKGETYILIKYPHTIKDLRPVCIQLKNKQFTLYNPKELKFPTSIAALDFTGFLDLVIDRYESMVKETNDTLNYYEENLENTVTKRDIHALFGLTHQLIVMQTSINAIGDVVDYITGEKLAVLWSEKFSYDYVNIQIEIRQLDKNIEMNTAIIDSIINVSESLFSNNMNQTMKTLTTATLILSIPTLITGFYGMNVRMPWQESEYALFIILAIAVIVTTISVYYFYRRKYL